MSSPSPPTDTPHHPKFYQDFLSVSDVLQFQYYMLKVSLFDIYPVWCSWMWTSSICCIVSVINSLKKRNSAIITSNISFATISPPFYILIIQMLHLLELPHSAGIFCSFLLHLFSFCFSVCKVSIHISSISLCFLQPSLFYW